MTKVPTEGIATSLDEHFESVAERHDIPGIAFGLVHHGRLVHTGGVGTVRVGAAEIPTLDTPSRICSMTKSFTAAGLLMLRDEGRLALDEPVEAYVPLLRALDPPTSDSPRVTVRHLMSMASGLPEDNAWADRHLADPPEDVDRIFAAGATFARAPGVAYEYSNLGWGMLGRVVEAIAGEPVQAFLTDRILGPLGLSATTWDRPDGDVLTGYRRQDDVWLQEPEPLTDGAFVAGGGLWSTVRDVGAWIVFLMDAFPPRDDPDTGLVSRASRREMQQVHRTRPSSLDEETGRLTAGGYGFGLVVEHDLRFGTIVRHAGGLPGFASHMMWVPDRRAGLVILTNLTDVPTGIVSLEALERLDDLGALPEATAEPTPQLRAACDGVIGLLIEHWDDDIADRLFADNVDQDEPRERRREQAEALRDEHGPFTADRISAKSRTEAAIRLQGSGGVTEVEVLLSPLVPSRVQSYKVTPPADRPH
ncbi:MAG TPA: serine hydrolase domain-containing protein [Actinomycetota bacterium]